jgi:two-component system sensor histidine kinase BaeS
VSAAVAVLIALLLGAFLARSLTRPIHELTTATKVLASGRLDHQVVVRSRDEVGELAASFNQMSLELAQAARARRQMTADLAHDLRTPLSILRGYTEGLGDGRLQGSSALYQLMHGEVVHLQRLVDDLRLLSLADRGALTLSRRPVDPAALLERAGLAHFVQAEEKGIALRVEVAEDLPAVDVDTDRLAQVLNNLVSNALRYTDTGEVVLSASARQGRIVLEVRDTGSGISPEDLPHVFDRFYRADPSRQHGDEDGASGLGLAIAKAIVEAHDGTISVASTLGEGTALSVSLPALHAGGNGAGEARHKNDPGRLRRLLADLGTPKLS